MSLLRPPGYVAQAGAGVRCQGIKHGEKGLSNSEVGMRNAEGKTKFHYRGTESTELFINCGWMRIFRSGFKTRRWRAGPFYPPLAD